MKALSLAAVLLFVFAEGVSAQNWWVCIKRYRVAGMNRKGDFVSKCPVCTRIIYTERADQGPPGENCRRFQFPQEAENFINRRCCQ
jgi:hypothetical protein